MRRFSKNQFRMLICQFSVTFSLFNVKHSGMNGKPQSPRTDLHIPLVLLKKTGPPKRSTWIIISKSKEYQFDLFRGLLFVAPGRPAVPVLCAALNSLVESETRCLDGGAHRGVHPDSRIRCQYGLGGVMLQGLRCRTLVLPPLENKVMPTLSGREG